MRRPYDAAMDNTLLEACTRSIESLHRFFVAWFRGARPDTDEVWREFEDELASSFELVTPDGHVLSREVLLPALRANHAQHRERRFEIEVRNVTVHHVTPSVVVAGYEEWQWLEDLQTARRSTAVFARAPDGSANLQWVHVHETWLPGKAP